MTNSLKLCPDCVSGDRVYTIKLISYNRNFVKFIPQIKESCSNCGRYIRFAPQTPELVNKFNQALQEVKIL